MSGRRDDERFCFCDPNDIGYHEPGCPHRSERQPDGETEHGDRVYLYTRNAAAACRVRRTSPPSPPSLAPEASAARPELDCERCKDSLPVVNPCPECGRRYWLVPDNPDHSELDDVHVLQDADRPELDDDVEGAIDTARRAGYHVTLDDPKVSAYYNARTCACGADAREHSSVITDCGGFDPGWEDLRRSSEPDDDVEPLSEKVERWISQATTGSPKRLTLLPRDVEMVRCLLSALQAAEERVEELEQMTIPARLRAVQEERDGLRDECESMETALGTIEYLLGYEPGDLWGTPVDVTRAVKSAMDKLNETAANLHDERQRRQEVEADFEELFRSVESWLGYRPGTFDDDVDLQRAIGVLRETTDDVADEVLEAWKKVRDLDTDLARVTEERDLYRQALERIEGGHGISDATLERISSGEESLYNWAQGVACAALETDDEG